MQSDNQNTLQHSLQDTLDPQSRNTLRTLTLDAVQAANSGHPGTSMGTAPIAYRLLHRCAVRPDGVEAGVSVAAASPLGWERSVGRQGAVIAMRAFGRSAPGPALQAHVGFEVAQVVAAAQQQIAVYAARA